MSAAARSFPTLISYLVVSVDETVSVSKAPVPAAPALALFASLVKRLKPILHGMLQHYDSVPERPPVRTAVESLDAELRRARSLVRGSAGSALGVRLIEGSVRSIGRCLGLMLLVWADAPNEVREGMRALHWEMITTQFGGRDIVPNLEDLVLRVKKGNDDQLGAALFDIGFLIRQGLVEDLGGGSVIQVLLNRLSSSNKENRLKIIMVLRSLALHDDENKERMTSMEALSSIVGSLTGDADERREAAGLLVVLSEISKVRQMIGRNEGCVAVLVALLNGDDPCASYYAGKLLGALSSSTQNVLLMAEAGYFMPLVQYLKEGSDMNKILMATTISRMELTDAMKASLGEEGSIEPFVEMFTSGKLEAKLSALGALRNLSSFPENIPRLIKSRIVEPLLHLLFSVTSVLTTLREPASAVLAIVARSELILKYKDVAQQLLSLLNLSSPAIQIHLLLALNSIASHSTAKRVRAKMKENGAMQLLLLFLTASNAELRTVALDLLFNLSTDFGEEQTDQLLGEAHLNILVEIISTSTIENEKVAAIGILGNLRVDDKIATEILARTSLLPVLTSLLEASIADPSSPTTRCLLERITVVMVRFTVPWDTKLQRVSASHGLIPCLVRILSDGSVVAKSRAATSLAQLSQNSPTLKKFKSSRWLCVPPHSQAFCEVHDGYCSVKNSFCLVKAGAISPMIRILEGEEREADEDVLDALATLMHDEIWENGAKAIEKASGVEAILRILVVGGSLKTLERAIWMLERIFRLETRQARYGGAAVVVLADLAENGDATLRPMVAKILAQLQHL